MTTKQTKFLTIFVIIICSMQGIAAPLTFDEISVTNLNGINGFTIGSSNNSVSAVCGNSLTVINHPTQSVIVVSGKYYLRNFSNQAWIDVSLSNGTNIFNTVSSLSSPNGYVPKNWQKGKWMIGCGNSFDSNNLHNVIQLVSYNEKICAPEINLTDDFWNVSCRIFPTNDAVNLSKSTCSMVGNFMGKDYAIGYRSENGLVRFLTQTNFSTETRYVPLDESNSLAFSGSGTPGWNLQDVGDVNGDGFDDVLVGAKDNPKCWLLFGGSSWQSNYVSLDAIGTNGVVLESEYSKFYYPGPGTDYPQSVGHTITRLGDMNGDGYDDFAYTDNGWNGTFVWWGNIINLTEHIQIIFGRADLQQEHIIEERNGFNGFKIKFSKDFNFPYFGIREHYFKYIAGGRDINYDGHNDILLISYFIRTINPDQIWVSVLYGGPFIKPLMELGYQESEQTLHLNCTNGFTVNTGVRIGVFQQEHLEWCNADINSDINGDGCNDIVLSAGAYYYSNNNAWVIYGGQSPSVPPALHTPLWINIGESNSLSFVLDSVSTNIVWTGCKKGDDYTLCFTNGARCTAWDIPMGELWFTNSYTFSKTNDILSISYTSTNALGPAAGFTVYDIIKVYHISL